MSEHRPGREPLPPGAEDVVPPAGDTTSDTTAPQAITDVRQAMAATPRRAFLPAEQRGSADLDQPLPIGHGQTNSQPTTVRQMLEVLDVRPGQRVLDVGAGSGWTTVILGRLVGPAGTVIGVELQPELAVWGGDNVRSAGLPWARLEPADPHQLGRPEQGPYDRILVSAEAAELPHALVAQLTENGTMVLPVAGRLLRVRREPGGPASVEHLGHYRFVPLR
jgi:protein-L-isoaspartate(D-aspartate) O-methyltransferase